MAEPFAIYDVAKRCRCGTEWLGKSFLEIIEGEPLPRSGTCGACLEKEQAQLEALTHPVIEVSASRDTELERPRATREPGEEP